MEKFDQTIGEENMCAKKSLLLSGLNGTVPTRDQDPYLLV